MVSDKETTESVPVNGHGHLSPNGTSHAPFFVDSADGSGMKFVEKLDLVSRNLMQKDRIQEDRKRMIMYRFDSAY